MALSTKYKGVKAQIKSGVKKWVATKIINKEIVLCKSFPFTDEGERLAALEYDRALIAHNIPPVNILKAKI